MAFKPSSGKKIAGTMLQLLGMLIMFGSFIYLVTSIQGTVQTVTERMSMDAGLSKGTAADAPDADAMQAQMQVRVYQFIAMLGVGIFTMFIGLILKASDEMGGGKNQKVALERMRYGNMYGGMGGSQ